MTPLDDEQRAESLTGLTSSMSNLSSPYFYPITNLLISPRCCLFYTSSKQTAIHTVLMSHWFLRPNSTWSFLLPFKAAAQSIPRISLVTEMLKNSDASRFITSLLPSALKGGYTHRTLLAFNAATLHDFIARSKTLDEGTLAYMLPALLEPLQHRADIPLKDAIVCNPGLCSVSH